jgi:DNA repair exonuclease SbcCD ATPase subunit
MSNRIHFKTLRYRNVFSTGQTMTVVDLDKSPSTMVTGKNGGGKSTMLDSLYFALFGKPFRKVNKPQMVNTKNNKDMLVELDFTVGEDVYMIRRGQKPDVFEVIKNGEKQNIQGDSRAFQQQLEASVLRMNYDVAAQIMAIGKAQHVSFMRLDSAKRRLFVESILGLLIFGKMSQLHSVKMAGHKERLIDLKAAVGSAGDKVKVRRKYIDDLKQSVLEAEQSAAEQSQGKITSLKSFIEDSSVTIDFMRSGMLDVIDIKPLQKKLSGFKELQTKFDMKIDDMLRRSEHLINHEFCEACEQQIPSDVRNTKHAIAIQKLAACRVARNDVAVSVEQVSAELEIASNQMAEYSKLNAKIQQLTYEINRATHEIDSLTTDKLQVASNLQAQIISETDSLTKLVDTHNKMRDKYEELLQQTEYMNLVTAMLKDSGIKSMLIKKYLPIINHSINSNLAELGFFAKFTLSETFDETIQARGIDTLSYNNFSEGEKIRIDMAILGAWRDIARLHGGVSSNLLFFDEIFDSSMDAAGTDSLMLLLAKMKDTNLFVITHTPEKIADKVRSHIQFGKVDGFSKML